MVQNIINQLKLRETCFNKNSFKLRCKQCNSYLNYDIQFNAILNLNDLIEAWDVLRLLPFGLACHLWICGAPRARQALIWLLFLSAVGSILQVPYRWHHLTRFLCICRCLVVVRSFQVNYLLLWFCSDLVLVCSSPLQIRVRFQVERRAIYKGDAWCVLLYRSCLVPSQHIIALLLWKLQLHKSQPSTLEIHHSRGELRMFLRCHLPRSNVPASRPNLALKCILNQLQ